MLTTYGERLRAADPPLHWHAFLSIFVLCWVFANGAGNHRAGTETATESIGFMDGAVQAGQRAAAEIISALQPAAAAAAPAVTVVPTGGKQSASEAGEKQRIGFVGAVSAWSVVRLEGRRDVFVVLLLCVVVAVLAVRYAGC
jgi:hypothetical protein